ncbi:MAG: tryptophan synthase subunit alpha [Bacteroidetes bacterium]|nr:MAG: tryptophan synthase subunit alpha [Bacteroidota bacterium]RLD84700.1 MAG: tryptophan synthase subunit alpha [Bacteroidota bacterium]
MKKITQILEGKNLLSIFLTAGFPTVERTIEILTEIEDYGVDFVELGMPFSDPLADGETIQQSSAVAIRNGMTLATYFEVMKIVRKKTDLPVVYMGYLNQILQFGVEQFCRKCNEVNIECLIIPDLPLEVYEREFKTIFEKHELLISFLVTPTTSDERILKIEELTTGFMYVVSSSSITGRRGKITKKQRAHYEKIKAMKLNKPTMIGFGIHDKKSYELACQYANGAIIGSEFIRYVAKENAAYFLTTLKA